MKKYILLFILFALPVTLLIAQEVTFRASAPPSVEIGANFRIDYTINASNISNLRLSSEFTDLFHILYEGTSDSRHFENTNGKQTSVVQKTFTYTVIAKKEGNFTIGPATIKVGNSDYKSNSLTINVLPPNQAAQTQQQQGGGTQQQSGGGAAQSNDMLSNENVFMRMIVSNRNVYEQEGFLVTFKIYSTYNIVKIDPKFPEFEGFLAQDIKLENLQVIPEQYNGRTYQTVVVKQSILFPQRSGPIQIGSGKVDVELRIPMQARVRSVFEDFFNTYQKASKEIENAPVTINVKPLPSGKPANYSNAVGNYSMSSEINKAQLKVNEAINIKLTFKGAGNIRLLKNPEVKFPNDFEVYDPVQNNNINVSTAGVSGTKTIEYMAIPRFAGDFEIPPITFSYFNTQEGAYKTISTESFKIHVEKDGTSSDNPVMANYSNRENVRFIGKDIRYLKTQKVNFQSYKDIFFGSFLYVMAYLMISVLFIAFFIIYRKQVRENANIALVRTKKANKTAVRRLKQAEKLLHDNKEEAFYEEVLRALWGYFSDKLNMPQSELTKENVSLELTKKGVDEALSNDFLTIIHTCEFARYAPSKAEGTMDKLFNETINAINTMENTIKK